MKKPIILAVLAFALSFTAQIQAQLIEAPTPPPRASAKITEAQFEMLLSAAPSSMAPGASTTIQSLSFFGTHLSIIGIPSSGVTDTKQVVLTSPQIAAFLAELPALPSGEVVSNIRNLNAVRFAGGINLFVQFSR